MNHYYRIAFTFLFISVSFGLIGPWLVSQSDSFLVAVGFGYIAFVALPVSFLLVRKYFKLAMEKISD